MRLGCGRLLGLGHWPGGGAVPPGVGCCGGYCPAARFGLGVRSVASRCWPLVEAAAATVRLPVVDRRSESRLGACRVDGGGAVPGVTMLHVSDTQFGDYHRFGEGIDSLASNLVVDLRRLGEEGVPGIDLIVFSGDIAEKGLRSEYVQARAFIDTLCDHAG